MGLVIVQAVVNYFIGVAVTAWAVMLSMGAARLNWWPDIPAMGYGDAFNIVLAGSLPIVLFAFLIWAFIALVSSMQ